ncbi:hypothetical protein DPEC_G00356610 [Dallia pectoralis]|uniref:Uncharacterized protein n=1 Tax=Dallia pectoralis TaxID=75939 RepID=A0ACC2F066_DALPE|nr:hypothetical protein DPEC_G00356610 [Dallia pectoralis]
MPYLHATGLALLALASVWYPCGADVGDFSPCLNFFYKSWPPKGLSGTPICQRYENQYRFASLYRRQRRSPVFSAYIYSQPEGKRPSSDWKFEPQLADATADGNMALFPPGVLDPNVVNSQAVKQDYHNTSFTRGHLNPSLHHETHTDRLSTFTLTNVVPQKEGSNNGPWEKLESAVNHTLGSYCVGEAYVVTGVIPYQEDVHWIKGHRVAVPEYLWSAYCCPKYNESILNAARLGEFFPTYAAIGRNDPNSTEEIVPIDRSSHKMFWGYDVKRMPLDTLEMYLKQRFGSVINVFYEKCLALR